MPGLFFDTPLVDILSVNFYEIEISSDQTLFSKLPTSFMDTPKVILAEYSLYID